MEIADIREGTVPAHFQERISEITCSLAKCPGVVAVILYGSAARKQMTPLSDLDICVVTQPAVSPDQWEAIMSRTGPALDLVLFSDLPPALQYRVVRDGIILWTCNRKILHRARADALRRYLDLKPFIGRNARRILENPGRSMNPPYDTERISTIIADIGRYERDLRELGIRSTGDLSDKKTFYAASMILFALLNRTIDLGNEVILARGFRFSVGECRQLSG